MNNPSTNSPSPPAPPHPALSPTAFFVPLSLRRRLLPLASTAALGLTGCMGAHPTPATAADLTPQQEAIQRVQQFTSGVDTAINQADPAGRKMSAALNGPRSDGTAAKPQVLLASNQNDASIAPANGGKPSLETTQTSASATAGNEASPAPVSKISQTPIATLTAVNQGVSGVPSSLGTMTAMVGSQRDRAPLVSAVAPAVPPVVSSASAGPGSLSAGAATTQPVSAPGMTNTTALPTPRDVASPIEGLRQSASNAIAASAPATVPAAVGAVAPTPVSVAAGIPPEPTVDAALNVLRKHAMAHPSLNSALALALLDTAQGRAPDTTEAAALSAPDQKLLADLLAALQGMTTPISASTTLADRASPLVDAAKKWQADADLSLPKLALASRVDSFGVYTPVDGKFPQGIKRTVIIYCEVANFACKKTDDGWYETHLSQQDTLITDDGLLIWRPTAEDVQDRSMNQRRDFYLVKKLTIPDTLAAGKYILRMSVTDHTTNKIAMTNLPIEITEK